MMSTKNLTTQSPNFHPGLQKGYHSCFKCRCRKYNVSTSSSRPGRSCLLQRRRQWPTHSRSQLRRAPLLRPYRRSVLSDCPLGDWMVRGRARDRCISALLRSSQACSCLVLDSIDIRVYAPVRCERSLRAVVHPLVARSGTWT